MLDFTRSAWGMKREQITYLAGQGSPLSATQLRCVSPLPRPRKRVMRDLWDRMESPRPPGRAVARRAAKRHLLSEPVCSGRAYPSRLGRSSACRALSWLARPLRGEPILRPTTPSRPAHAASTRRFPSVLLSRPPVPVHKFFSYFQHLMLQSCKRAGSSSSVKVPFICDPARLRNRRMTAGMTVADLARLSQVDGTTISRIETGQDPRLSTWNRINAALPQVLE